MRFLIPFLRKLSDGESQRYLAENQAQSSFSSFLTTLTAIFLWSSCSVLLAEISLPNIFSDHMVLQRGQENRLWGRGEPGEKVTASIGQYSVTIETQPDGTWFTTLPKMEAGGPYVLTVKGNNQITFDDILIGEVWVCSGQSNMQWSVKQSNDADIEKLSANYPKIRMINFPQVGSQEPVWSHDRKWMVCSPETVGDFSAVGYFFGRQLFETIDVPIGLVNNAWGGSAAEAWVDRRDLEADPDFVKMIKEWDAIVAKHDELTSLQESQLDDEKKSQVATLKNQIRGNHRPGNIYNGVLKSHLGYGIRGVIWYQGESNAGRAYQYRKLFPFMIQKWREAWGQGDFPFYYVQLADYMDESDKPTESGWAELRESQTMTMSLLPHTGQAVTIDIGEGKDIHPKNKADVGKRLARWALANDYGIEVAFRSPQYESMEMVDDKLALKFLYAANGWRPFDTKEPQGFQIAGEDRNFVWAKAEIQKDNSILVSSPEITKPVAVRYAWSNNPKCNLYGSNGLPLTPFRTDDWPGITVNANGK